MGKTIELYALSEFENVYLVGNPDLSCFKSVYRKQQNFSINSHLIHFKNKLSDYNSSKKSTVYNAVIPRHGELLNNLYLEIDISCQNNGNNTYTVNHFLNSLVKNVQLSFGSELITEYWGQWKQMKDELHYNNNQNTVYVQSSDKGGLPVDLNFTQDINRTHYNSKQIINGDMPLIIGGVYNSSTIDANSTKIKKKLIYTFDFWFNRNLGSSLPLICLDNNYVDLKVEIEQKSVVIGDSTNISHLSIDEIKLNGDYIYLDEETQKLFRSQDHSYLIEQVQQYKNVTNNSSQSTTLLNKKRYELDFSHPVKYLMWAIQNTGTEGNNKGQGPCYFVSQTVNSLYGNDGAEGKVTLRFNNAEKIKDEPIINFTRLYPNKYFSSIPELDRIGVYSFATYPMSPNPSGTCNFSRISFKEIEFQFSNIDVTHVRSCGPNENIPNKNLLVYAVNYNILKIKNNYGALLFAN